MPDAIFRTAALSMRSLLAACLMTCAALTSASDESPQKWRIYTDLDLFAYSEPVSIDSFADKFDDKLQSGDTAFTHNRFEIGGEFRGVTVALVQRFDYITEFSEDTAFFHHSSKNGIPIDDSQVFNLYLDVERITATGLKAGYTWDARPDLKLYGAFTWYFDASRLQSGSASVVATEDLVDPQLLTDIQAVFDAQSGSASPDISAIYNLIADVRGGFSIDYAYNSPRFSEETYRQPVLIGARNPTITGVDFDAPDGSGYSVDLGIFWQARKDLGVSLQVWDAFNEFEWNGAPQTTATFDLNPFLNDFVGVAQDLLDGLNVFPNELVDRYWITNIRNQTYRQELPARAKLAARWDSNWRPDFLGWKPNVALLGSWYHTTSQDFPRLGVALDNFQFEYDTAAQSFAFGWRGRYGHVSLVTDDFDFKQARTFGFAVGLNLTF